uniref:Protein arginine N-methyltransferase domain-containing protein n=1 Tax=Amphimedon queenslandica TaxID=400682 RepID=A0A1X7TER4_AMPQE
SGTHVYQETIRPHPGGLWDSLVTKSSGLVGYFVIGFEVPSYPVYFSTSPQDTPTHWHQRIFFLNEPIQVQTVIYYVVAIRARIVQDHLISRYR